MSPARPLLIGALMAATLLAGCRRKTDLPPLPIPGRGAGGATAQASGGASGGASGTASGEPSGTPAGAATSASGASASSEAPASGAGAGSGSSGSGDAGSATADEPQETVHVELKPPPGADMSTPQKTHEAARRFARNKRFRNLFRLGMRQDLVRVALAMHMTAGQGLNQLREQDRNAFEALYREYDGLLAEHGVRIAMARDPLDLYAGVDLPALLADTIRFIEKLPVQDLKHRSFAESTVGDIDAPLTDVRVQGDRATARCGGVFLGFRRLFDRWFIQFMPNTAPPK